MSSLVLDPKSYQIYKEQIKHFVASGLLPNHVNTPQKALAIAQMGKELGLEPMTAFSSIYVVNGKPSLSAELMQALIYKKIPNAEIIFLEISNSACKIKARRSANVPYTEIAFTIDDAKSAGLANGGTWQKYPRALLRSRAVSEMARTLFPDCLAGFSYTPEELGDTTRSVTDQTENTVFEQSEFLQPTKSLSEPASNALLSGQEGTNEAEEKSSDIDDIDKALGEDSTGFGNTTENLNKTEKTVNASITNQPLHEEQAPLEGFEVGDPWDEELPNFAPQTQAEALGKSTSFKFKIGKHKGKFLDELSIAELTKWYEWSLKQEEPNEILKQHMEAVHQYLNEYNDLNK